MSLFRTKAMITACWRIYRWSKPSTLSLPVKSRRRHSQQHYLQTLRTASIPHKTKVLLLRAPKHQISHRRSIRNSTNSNRGMCGDRSIITADTERTKGRISAPMQAEMPQHASTAALSSNLPPADASDDEDTVYIRDQWIGKRKLRVGIPTSEPMEFELTNDRTDPPLTNQTESVAPLQYSATEIEFEAQVREHIADVSYLQDYPRTNDAMDLMRRVVREILPIMRKYGWTVDHLTEFYPKDGKLLGANHLSGTVIIITLRDLDDPTKFQEWELILTTALHELCHNTIKPHDRDFWTVYYDITTELGLSRSWRLEAFQEMYESPGQPHFWDQVAVSTGGAKVFINIADFRKHFSIYADYDNTSRRIVQLSRKYHPSVTVRLIQLAKGLDPGDDKPYYDLANAADYGIEHHGSDTFSGNFDDNYEFVGSNAFTTLELYIQMYKAGEDYGWNSSSRQWLMGQVQLLLEWDPRVGNGPWTEPKLETSTEVTLHLAEMVGQTYLQTTSQDQCLRDVAAKVLREVSKICQQPQDRFDTDILSRLTDQVPELRSDIVA